MANDNAQRNDVKTRIRERAYKIWLDEGKPEGRDLAHWELAKLAIDEEDALPTMVRPAPSTVPE